MTTRRTPFDEMHRFFDQFRGDAAAWPTVHAGEHEEADLNLTMERTDVGYVVLADLPGFERDEIDLTFEDGSISLRATHEVDADTHYRSRSTVDRFTVPDNIDADAITATYRNGVLEITLPTTESLDEPRNRIEIE